MKRLMLSAVLTLLASSCSFLEPVPDLSRFYVLAPVGQVTAGEEAGTPLPGVSLGLGALNMPAYANRHEIVRRVGPTQVQPSSVDRWAGPLDLNALRVLSENLSRLLGTDRIFVYPSYEVAKADYWVQIDVTRFDLDEANRGHLTARWVVRDNQERERSVSRMTEASHDAASPDMAAGVEALSLCLADLSRDSAAAVRQLAAARR